MRRLATLPLLVVVWAGRLFAGPPPPTPTPTPVITEPEELSRPFPPPDHLWRGCEAKGIPIISFVVRADGTTTSHRLIRSSGCDSADRLYVNYIRKWRYKPGTVNGKAVPVEVTITTTVNWK